MSLLLSRCLAAAWVASMSLQMAMRAQDLVEDRQKAVQALRARDFGAALQTADQMISLDQNNCEAWTLRGLALQGSLKDQDALSSFEHARGLCPKLVPALEGVAQIQYAQRSPDARQTLQELLTLRPEEPTANAMLAVLDWQKGDCPSALLHFEKSAALTRSNPESEREFASCLIQAGDADRAVPLYQHLVDRSRTQAAELQLAFALWKAGHADRALDELLPLLEADHPSAATLVLGAQIAEGAGDTPKAVKWLRQAIVAEPSVARNYVLFASIAFDHTSCQVGIDMIDAGLKVVPQPAPLYLARGVLHVQLSQLGAALGDFEQAHRLDPRLSFAEDALGMMHSQQHQGAAALETFRNHARESPRDAFLQYLYAEALSQAQASAADDPKALDEAIAAARRAIALEPDYQPAHDLLSALYLRADQPAAAMMEADIALKRNPEDQLAVYHKLLATRRLGRKDEVGELVTRLNRLKQVERETTTRYLLEEAAVPVSPLPHSSSQQP